MNADIYLRAAELEFNEHEYSCLCLVQAAHGAGVYDNDPYWQLFCHDSTIEGWWEVPPSEEPDDEFFHQARTYALLLAWAMALEGDL